MTGPVKPLAACALAVAVAACPTSAPSDDDDNDDDEGCTLGRFTVSSVRFEERGCLDVVDRDGGLRAAFGTGLSWRVDRFSTELDVWILDDTNSSAAGRYEREGAVWVAFTGAVGGQPLGESTVTIEALDGDTWQGTIDGVAVPDTGNDSLDSVFVTIVVGP